MSSTLRLLAQALADSLSAQTFTSVADPVTVLRANWPSFTVEELINPVLAITPPGYTTERAARTAHIHDYQVSAFLGRHTPTEAMADAMLDLTEEVVDLIRDHRWTTLAPAVTWPTGASSPQTIAVTINPEEGLQDRNVWRVAIDITYRLPKAHL